jgi:hypothetical protein
MRVSGRAKLLGLAVISVICAVGTFASIDYPGPPTWSLTKTDYDPAGSAAMLLPSNDTRVNLYLLLADRRGATVLNPKAKQEGPPLVLFPWSTMAERMVPAQEQPQQTADSGNEPKCNANTDGSTTCTIQDQPNSSAEEWDGPTRCQSNESGATDFIKAVRANRHVSDAEKNALIAARQALTPTAKTLGQYDSQGIECEAEAPLPATALTSDAAREFGAYLEGAQLFYAGRFTAASAKFRLLSRAGDPWVRETALYMIARTELNEAINRSLDEYGSLADLPKRDVARATAAGGAFNSYLTAYPQGHYASSARGLLRRAHWFAGDTAALSSDFGRQISSATPYDGAVSDADLVEEIDEKLPLPNNSPQAIRDPLLLAVVDLHRMRNPGTEYSGEAARRADCCGPTITKTEIERQRSLFGNDTQLYNYVLAAEAYFVRHQPGEVLQLIPDAAHQKRFTYLQFSRQMLRGMALQDVGDHNARPFLLSLFPGAVQPYQHGALELALAMQEEKSGRLDLVFAPDSQVRHPIIRQLLLEHIAGPDLLRQQANGPDVSKMEREAALYMLLTKELRNGMFRPFLSDLRLVASDAPKDSWYPDASSYQPEWWEPDQRDRPPLGKFTAADFDDSGCPALTVIAGQLAGQPQDIRARLCLAEFFRDNGFDGFSSYESPAASSGLASTRSLFPAKAYSRLEVYKAIMSDAAASPDDKAFALNRAVRCYAPGGNNSCDGKEVGLAVRRGWFNRLKADYPQSRWAKDLKYYW